MWVGSQVLVGDPLDWRRRHLVETLLAVMQPQHGFLVLVARIHVLGVLGEIEVVWWLYSHPVQITREVRTVTDHARQHQRHR